MDRFEKFMKLQLEQNEAATEAIQTLTQRCNAIMSIVDAQKDFINILLENAGLPTIDV